MRPDYERGGVLAAPFPYFGGKSRVAAEVWARFGNVPNLVDPFCGSLAVLLARPHVPRIETVNDKDCYVANFWRAVQDDAESVAFHADWPVNEADLEARHYWLVTEGKRRIADIVHNPELSDPKVAGWWAWGLCSWIGSGWCDGDGPFVVGAHGWERRNAGQGVNRQLPHLGNAGQGVNRQLPHLGDAGKGVNRQLPHLGDAGKGILNYMLQLQTRLRRVRVCCGDWTRVLTPSVTFAHGLTGVFLDPPYGEGEVDYMAGGNRTNMSALVREWAIANGDNPYMRIALCGYEGQHDMPDSWTCHAWKAKGGYGSTAKNDTSAKLNRYRERIWFSPHCLNDDLFREAAP